MNQKYSVWKIAIVSLAGTAIGAMWMVFNAYVPLILQGGGPALGAEQSKLPGFGLGAAATGFIVSLHYLALLIIGPIVGLMSDGLKSRLGSRLPYILHWTPALVLSMVGAAFLPELIRPDRSGDTMALMPVLIAYLAALILMVVASAFMTMPATAIIYDWSPSEKHTTTSAVMMVVGFLAMVVVLGASSALFDLYRPLPFLLLALILLIAVLGTKTLLKGPTIATSGNPADEPSLPPRQILAALKGIPRRKRRSLLILILSDLLNGTGYAILMAFISSYGVSKLSMQPGAAGGIMIIYLVISALLALPGAWLVNKLGRRPTRAFGMALVALGCLPVLLAPSVTSLMISVVLISLGSVLPTVGNTPLYVDHLPPGAMNATALSIANFAAMLSAIFGQNLAGIMVAAAGNDYGAIWPLTAGFMLAAAITSLFITEGEIQRAAREAAETVPA